MPMPFRYQPGLRQPATFRDQALASPARAQVLLPTAPLSADFSLGTLGATVAPGDAGSATAWDTVTLGTGTALVYDATHAVGAQSAKVSIGSTNSVVYAAWSTALGTATDHYGGGSFWLDANPPDVLSPIRVFDSNAATCFRIGITAAGTVRIFDWAGVVVATGTQPVPVGAWFRIDFHAAHGVSGTLEVRITDNVGTPVEAIVVNGIQIGYNAASIRFGNTAAPAAMINFTCWMDSLGAGLTAWKKNTGQLLTQTAEADSATAAGHAKTVRPGQPLETDSAFAVTARRARTFGQAQETDTAGTVPPRRTRTVGQALEADTAQAVVPLRVRATGQATETDSATAAAHTKTVRLGQPVESDEAHQVAPDETHPFAAATQSDTAMPVTAAPRRLAQTAVEAETAQPVTPAKSVTTGEPAEMDAAQAVTPARAVTINAAVETDTAATVGPAVSGTVTIGQAVETDTAASVFVPLPVFYGSGPYGTGPYGVGGVTAAPAPVSSWFRDAVYPRRPLARTVVRVRAASETNTATAITILRQPRPPAPAAAPAVDDGVDVAELVALGVI